MGLVINKLVLRLDGFPPASIEIIEESSNKYLLVKNADTNIQIAKISIPAKYQNIDFSDSNLMELVNTYTGGKLTKYVNALKAAGK